MSWLTLALAGVLVVLVSLWLFPEGKAAVGRWFSWLAGMVIVSLVLGVVVASGPPLTGILRELLGRQAVDTLASVGVVVGIVALVILAVYLGFRHGWTPGQWRHK